MLLCTLGFMYLFELVFWVFLDVPRSGIAESYGSSMFSFWEPSILFSTVAIPIYVPISSVQGLSFFHILANICCVCSFFDDRHSQRCEVISHLVLICISLMISDIEHLFIYLLAVCIFSLAQHLFASSVHFKTGVFVFLMLDCMGYLRIWH